MAALWAHMRRSVGACHRFSASVWARVGLRDVPASFAPSISAPLMIFVPPGLVVILGTSRARFRRQGDSRNNGMGHAAHDAAYRCSCGWSAATGHSARNARPELRPLPGEWRAWPPAWAWVATRPQSAHSTPIVASAVWSDQYGSGRSREQRRYHSRRADRSFLVVVGGRVMTVLPLVLIRGTSASL